MSRIGVESAFEVLVKARALEKQGKSVIHLEIGEPDFPTPKHVVEAGKRALDEGWTKYGPTQGLPELRESIAAYISRTRNIKVGSAARVRGAGRETDHVLRDRRAARSRRRGDLPQSRLSDLRIDDQVPGRQAGADSAGGKPRLLLRPGPARTQPDEQDQAGDPEFAGESDRRHHAGGRCASGWRKSCATGTSWS